MAMRCWPTYLLIGGLFACASAVGQEEDLAANGQCDQRIELTSSKPDLSDYDDYNTFLVDVMRHKHREEQRRQHRQRCPELYESMPVVDKPPEPEDMDQAVAQSPSAEPDRTRDERTKLTPAEREQLGAIYLQASMEALSETDEAREREVRLGLLRLAEAMADPNKDMTREEMRRVFEDQQPSVLSPFFVSFMDPDSLARVAFLEPGLRLNTTVDGSERMFSIIYTCSGPLCPTRLAFQ